MSGDQDPAYIAVHPCGCVTACTVDLPHFKKHVAKDVAEWLADGLAVERTTVADARERLTFTCPHQGNRKWHEIWTERQAAA